MGSWSDTLLRWWEESCGLRIYTFYTNVQRWENILELFFPCDSLCGNSTDLMHRHLRTALQGGAFFQGQASQHSHTRFSAIPNLKAMQGFTSLYIGNPYLLPALRKAKSDRTASKSLTLLMTAPPFPPFHCSRQVADFDCLALVETTRQKQKAVGSFDVSVHDTFASEAQWH